jgi:heme exporter protein C
MKPERKPFLVLLTLTYAVVILGMYRALILLGPLDPALLRYGSDPMRHGYKIFFFAMQNAPVIYLAFFVTLLGSVMYLKTRNMKWDIIASGSAMLATLFCTLVLVNGAIFSNLAWGAYWNWDPRQTTVLFLWFILAGYHSLRLALGEEEARARLSSVVGILGFVGVPLTHISATIWTSNHPQIYDRASSAGFSLDSSAMLTFILMLLGALALYSILLWLTVRIKTLERKQRHRFGG